MKIRLFRALVAITLIAIPLFSCDDLQIVDCTDAYNESVCNIIFQDPSEIILGSSFQKTEFKKFLRKNRDFIENSLKKNMRDTKVLLKNGNVVGFIGFGKAPLYSRKKLITRAQIIGGGVIPTDDATLDFLLSDLQNSHYQEPHIALLCLAIDIEARHQGHAKRLLTFAESTSKIKWPEMKTIRVSVNQNNWVARELFESHGYTLCPRQPKYLQRLRAVGYQKQLS